MANSYVNDFTHTVQTYYKDIKNFQPMTKDEEKILMLKAKNNDLDAKNKILTSNLKFVFDVAKKYKGQGVPMEDLISEGNLGLAYAFDKFDVNKDVKFFSYAVWWIKWYIKDYIARTKKKNDLISQESDNIIDDDKDEPIEPKHDISSENDDTDKKEQNEIIKKLLDKLDWKERVIIESYFGLNDSDSMTLKECGNLFGLSQERIRQMKKESISS